MKIHIIGGGIIGLSSAYYLNQAGYEVEIIDKDEMQEGCSYGNAGMIVPSHFVPLAAPGVITKGIRWMFNPKSPFYIKPSLRLDLARWLWAFRAACTHEKMMAGAEILLKLHRQSHQLFRELSAEIDCDFHEMGLLHLHLSEKYRQAGEKEAHILRSLGLEAISLDRDGLEELEPNIQDGIESGIFFPEHAHLDPTKFVTNMATQAAQEGRRR